MDYEIVVGLEIHAELATKTKIFCGCKNSFGDEVNTNTCPTCLAMPGTLPVLNEEVVNFAIKAGHAMNCRINPVTRFDRKNYFYPDLTKGYQITQFEYPICTSGYVEILDGEEGNTKKIRINRIHIEEDTGKLIHDNCFEGTLADFNRCGVPLIEIVSEPDLRSPEDTKAFLEAVKAILVAIGVSDGKMQEGSIRCDVNVSVMPKGSDVFGTRVEMKNVNTFSGAMRAVEYEAARQIKALENGEALTQETRRWDDLNGRNFVMRTKEDAQDYRYFPEGDLTSLCVTEEKISLLKDSLPELPLAKTLRFLKSYNIPLYDANLLVENPDKAQFFERCCELLPGREKQLSNWILSDITRILNEKDITLADSALTPESLCEMVGLIDNGTISGNAGKTVIEIIMAEDRSVADIVSEKGLAQISDTSALEEIAKEVLAANEKAAAQYREGKTNVLGFLVGQCMKASKGKGNPAVLSEILSKLL